MPMNWGAMPLDKVKVMIGGKTIAAYVTGMTMDFNTDAYGIEWMADDGVHGTATVARKEVVEGAFPPTIIADSVYKSYDPPYQHGSYALDPKYAYPPLKPDKPADYPVADLSQIEADLAKLPAPDPAKEWNLNSWTNVTKGATLSMQDLKKAMDEAEAVLTDMGKQPLLKLPDKLQQITKDSIQLASESIAFGTKAELEEVLKLNKIHGQYHINAPGIGPVTVKVTMEVTT